MIRKMLATYANRETSVTVRTKGGNTVIGMLVQYTEDYIRLVPNPQYHSSDYTEAVVVINEIAAIEFKEYE